MSALLTSFTPSCISTPISFLLIPYLPCLLRGCFPSLLVSSFLLLFSPFHWCIPYSSCAFLSNMVSPFSSCTFISPPVSSLLPIFFLCFSLLCLTFSIVPYFASFFLLKYLLSLPLYFFSSNSCLSFPVPSFFLCIFLPSFTFISCVFLSLLLPSFSSFFPLIYSTVLLLSIPFSSLSWWRLLHIAVGQLFLFPRCGEYTLIGLLYMINEHKIPPL